MHNPHDRLFRHVFSDPAHAAGELRSLLPRAVADRIAWHTLTPLAGTFIDPELAELETDLLFSASLDGRDALLYLLLEHQSTADPFMIVRLLAYLERIWRKYRKEHPDARRLPAIVPLVVYHSAHGWNHPTSLHPLIDADPETLAALAPHRFYERKARRKARRKAARKARPRSF